MARILIVDDEENIRYTFAAFFEEEGFEVHVGANFDEGIAHLAREPFDVIFSDIALGGRDGIDFLRASRDNNPQTPVVLITGYPHLETATDALRLGAFDYISKPVRRDTLLRVARLALQHKRLVDERESFRTNLEAVFRSVRDGILMVDQELQILGCNQTAIDLCGFPETGPLTAAGRCAGGCVELLRKTLISGDPQEINRHPCQHQDRRSRVVHLSATPLIDGRDRAIGAVLVVRDETRLDNLERQFNCRNRFHRMIGQSVAMQKNYHLIEKLAELPTTVLITGESGTGKELVVDALHSKGARGQGPLIKVNCAALPENLLESELFGHVRGAFTGAVKDKAGRFELADGGTLFLDEIGDISPAMQVRLLRVLQERVVERIGESRSRSVDIRVVAATNCDLAELVQQGRFRDDLYYRLRVVNLHMPPLRERREDIPFLVQHFIDQFNTRFGKSIQGVSDEALQLLSTQSWPGNIRELEHCLEHAFVVSQGCKIELDDLPVEVLNNTGPSLSLQKAKNGIDSKMIRDALTQAGGNKAKAARLLGIHRRTLYRKLQNLEIPSP